MRAAAMGAALVLALGAGCGGDEAGSGTGGAGAGGPSGGGANTLSGAATSGAGIGGAAALELDQTWRVLAATPNRDLSLLALMVRLDALHTGSAPFIRDLASYERLALAAEAIAAMCDEDAFTQYTSAPDFARAPERFEELRLQLLDGARAAAAAARANDVSAFYDAFVAMDASCVGCHKRYGPLH
jgi:cytochrome c556